jgi:predicted ATP-binding protein involved in virulence
MVMRIKQISVSGLFGIFNHVIPLNMDERITIIHGPNGFGKTAMLRMLNGLFNSQYSVFRNIPFSNFRVDFDNDSTVEIVKNSDNSEKINNTNSITFYFNKPSLETVPFLIKEIKNPPEIDFTINILEDIVPGLERVGNRKWVSLHWGNSFFKRGSRAF